MRILHRLYAHLFGYFWLPCPLCGRMFGGHEGDGCGEAVLWDDGRAYVVCTLKECQQEATLRRLQSPYGILMQWKEVSDELQERHKP
jgi:hypothetical protein